MKTQMKCHIMGYILVQQNIGEPLCVPMEFPIKFDTVKPGWSIIYIEGSQVIIFPKNYISFSEDQFCLVKQCRP